jgi:hypothetical protein
VEADDCHRGADERRGREVGSSPGRSKVSEREHEQNQTHTVAEESEQEGAGEYRNGRPVCAQCRGESSVHRPGNKPSDHGDLHRIATGNFLREVVVDSPS